MLIGETDDYESQIPAPNAGLYVVAFPMEDMTYYGDDADHPDPYTINNETELHEWAKAAFFDYEIWDMEVPEAAIVKEEDED